MNRILHSDPRAGYLAHQSEIDAAIARVLQSGEYILGAEVTRFEEEFAGYLGSRQVVSTGNGTDAIELALRAFEIGRGDEVITVANTAVATVAAIERAGASAVLIDVDNQTLTMSPQCLREAVESKKFRCLQAVIPVHLYGQPADMDVLMEIARRHGLKVIEDCAQAHGSAIDGRKVGTLGDAAAYSFYPTKNLGALGDGGALVTDDAALAERARELRVYGWKERYISERPGLNTRLDDLQAAVLRVKLTHLEIENARRRQIATEYDRLLREAPVLLPVRRSGADHCFHQYVIRTPRRDELRRRLGSAGVRTGVLYPVPIHEQPAYRGRVGIGSDLQVSERAARELLCLPLHPWLSDDDVSRVASVIVDWTGPRGQSVP